MTFLKELFQFFLHIDKNLMLVVSKFGSTTYVILFIVIFMETGLVVTPFLPGDSLIFAAGALSGAGSLNIWTLYVLLTTAAFLGDTANYWIGHGLGPKAFEMNSKLLKREHLEKAQAFYEKHGGKAIMLARFVPIVRTFAPFVAGVGKMEYRRFMMFNALGGVLWVSLFLWTGHFFGNIPFVKENFHYVMVVIILISVVPMAVEWYRSKRVR